MTFTIEVTGGPPAPKEWKRGYLAAKRVHDQRMTENSIAQAVARYGRTDKPPTTDHFNAGWAAFFWCVGHGVDVWPQ